MLVINTLSLLKTKRGTIWSLFLVFSNSVNTTIIPKKKNITNRKSHFELIAIHIYIETTIGNVYFCTAMIILSTAYLGNISYYARLLQTAESGIIDLGEHYRKQSIRNRCEILGANGVIALSVPVHKRSGVKIPVYEVRIDASKAWQHRHWNAIRSAYKNSPYFDHYAECFEPIYRRPYDKLWELNRDLQQAVLESLDLKTKFTVSTTYRQAAENDRDWREGFSEKPRLRKPDPDFSPLPYYQVFSERLPFAPNLSILDLLFCEGPRTPEVINGSRSKGGV
jgi:hypothetical protein